MKFFITLLLCTATIQLVLSADPPPSDPASDSEKGDNGAADSADDAKDKAKKEVSAALDKAKLEAKDDKEISKKLDDWRAKILKAIDASAPAKGGSPPVQPPSGA